MCHFASLTDTSHTQLAHAAQAMQEQLAIYHVQVQSAYSSSEPVVIVMYRGVDSQALLHLCP